MSPTASDFALADFIRTHPWISFIYYIKVAWPYLIVAFLLGSIPFGVIVGRVFYHQDIRDSGSGNIGAANAARTFGRGAGIAVLLLDAAKGAIAVWFGKSMTFGLLTAHSKMPFFATPMLPHLPYQFGDTPISVELATMALIALAAVLGHCFSPWLGFKGGKGVATFLGTLIALGPYSPIIFVIVWALVAVRTGYASLASMLATAAVTIFVIFKNYNQGDGNGAIFFVVCALAIVVAKHAPNIARLQAGTEPKLAFGGSKGPTDSHGKRAQSI